MTFSFRKHVLFFLAGRKISFYLSALLAVAILASSSILAQGVEDLLEVNPHLDNKPQGKEIQSDVPNKIIPKPVPKAKESREVALENGFNAYLVVNGKTKDVVRAITDPNNPSDTLFPSGQLLVYLSQLMKPEIIAKVDSLATKDRWIKQKDLQRLGITVQHRDAADEISLSIPSEYIAPKIHDADTSGPPVTKTFAFSKTRDELFREIFKRDPPPLPEKLEVSLILNDRQISKVWVRMDKNGVDYAFPAYPLAEILAESLKSETARELEGKLNNSDTLTSQLLRSCGILSELNLAQFTLKVTIPSRLLAVQTHMLTPVGKDPEQVNTLKPSMLSAYLNFRLIERFQYLQNSPLSVDTGSFGQGRLAKANNQVRQPLLANLEGAVNYRGAVFEGEIFAQEDIENRDIAWNRKQLRLVYDFHRQAVRAMAGDILFPTAGYQRFLPMAGIGLARNFSLKPHEIAYPTEQYEFYLENQSEVKIFVNGQLVQSLLLNPGSHNLKGIPMIAGESDVDIIIRDVTGREQRLYFSTIFEPSLLAPGRSLFSYNLGFPSRQPYVSAPLRENEALFWNYAYGYETPILSLFHKQGVTKVLTLGAYGQVSPKEGVFGMEGLQALKIGSVHLNLAGQFDSTLSPEFAGRLAYTRIPKRKQGDEANTKRLTWRGEVELLSRGFSPFHSGNEFQESINLTGFMNLPFEQVNANLGGGYSFRYDTSGISHITLDLNKQWVNRLSSALSLRYYFDDRGVSNTSISARLNYSFWNDNNGFIANQRSESHRYNAYSGKEPRQWDNYTNAHWEYNTSASYPINPTASAGISFSPEINDFEGRLGFRANEGLADIVVRRMEPTAISTQLYHQNYSEIRLHSALVFADGNFALSRPVNGGFLMTKGVKSHRKSEILVNPNQMGYDAKSNRYNAGVLPNLSAYNLKQIRLEAINSPIGASLPKTDFTLYPTYKTGYSIQLGIDATTVAMGTLIQPDGEYVKQRVINVTYLGDKVFTPITSFTNSMGRFQLPSLLPGRYRIQIAGQSLWEAVEFEIPAGTEGLYQLGQLKVPLK